ncbi:ribosomal protein S5-alanine N-acetyltransferase [Shigella sonnei]
MFGYRSNVPKVRLTTDRLVVRLVHDRDAWRLADYYAENRHFLKPWEPVRDESHCYPSGWQARLGMINEFHKQGSAFYFGLFDPDEKEIIGVANFSNVVRGSFHACLREWREERGQGVVHKPIPGWQSTLEQRGFVGCARHFIECVQNQTVLQTAGEQAVLAQRIVDKIWRDAMSE